MKEADLMEADEEVVVMEVAVVMDVLVLKVVVAVVVVVVEVGVRVEAEMKNWLIVDPIRFDKYLRLESDHRS